MVQSLAPAANDPVHENPWFGRICIAALLLSCVGTYLVGQAVFPLGKADYVLSATPFFFLMIVIELLLIEVGGALKNNPGGRFTFSDTWSSITAGNTQQILGHLAKRWIPFGIVYNVIHKDHRLVEIPEDNWIAFCGIFIICDFIYYWYHRFGHSVGLLWSGHNVHHSSEHFNFSTALRQSWSQAVLSGMWYLPAALIFPPRMFAVANQWVTIYQFWIHTCVVRRISFLEHVLNTPSHHRVHHDRRVHKNFGGVLIIWDRMFGTFHDELNHGPVERSITGDGGETCYFGIQDVTTSFAEAATQSLLFRSMVLGPMGFVQGPGLLTCTAERPLPKISPISQLRLRIDQKNMSLFGKVYIGSQLLLCIVGMMFCALHDSTLSNRELAAASFFLLAGMVTSGLLMDGARSAILLELLRCCIGVYIGLVLQVPLLVRACAVSAVLTAGGRSRLLGQPTNLKEKQKTA
jgi:alkylglycerol monooxygenase